jgi:PAS domain S-box-containing protein
MLVEKARSDQKGLPLLPLVAAFVISMLAVAAMILILWQLEHRIDGLRAKQLLLSEYNSRVMLFDEALTMSVRMAAATGDLAYKKRYDKIDAELDTLIKHVASAFRRPEVGQFIRQTDQINRKLVEIERRALTLAGERRLAEASALLVSGEYLRLKDAYADAVDKTVSSLNGAIEAQVRRLKLLAAGLAIASGVVVLVLLWAWYYALRAGRRWSEERLRAEAALNEACDELEFRVRDRTADLQAANNRLDESTTALTLERDFSTALIDSLPGFFVQLDENGRIVRWNNNLSVVTGLSNEELRGLDALWNVVEGDRDLARERIRDAFNTGVADAEFGVRTKSGGAVCTHWSGLRIASEGRPNLLAVGVDVTAEREAESRLRESEEMFRAISTAAQDAMLVLDDAGRIVFWNQSATRIFGYAEEEAIGQNAHVLLAPASYREAQAAGWSRFAKSGQGPVVGKVLELAALRKDGTEFPIEISVSAIQHRGCWQAIGIVRDISERKQQERIKQQFISTVSHELRTPATSIMGSLGLLNARVGSLLPESYMQLLKIAHRNCERLVCLINDILDVEKLGSDRMVLDLKPVEVRALVEHEIEGVQGFAILYDVRVQLSPEAVQGVVRADAKRLAQAVTNLLSNAIKFSPRGAGVLVGIEDRKGMIDIFVRDHGPGIPDDFKDRIFERFAQVDATDARQRGGTGLGLSITKQIVEKLDGKVDFEPAPGGGTIFHIALPCWEQEIERRPTAKQPTKRSAVA